MVEVRLPTVGLGMVLLFGILAGAIDKFFGATINSHSYIHVGGTIGAVTSVCLFLLFFVWRLGGVKSWTFYGLVFPLFLTSTLDHYCVIQLWQGNSTWSILPNYVYPGDELLECVYSQILMMQDGTFLHLINFIVLYNWNNGLSWRSLALFNSSFLAFATFAFTAVMLTMQNPVSMLTKIFSAFIPYVILLPAGPLLQPRSFTFRTKSVKEPKGFMQTIWGILTFSVMITTMVIFVGKFLVACGLSSFGPLSTIFEETDPMILFEGVAGAIPFGVVNAWFGLVFVVPAMAVIIFFMIKAKMKPTWLWDLAVVQAAVIFVCQGYSIVGPLHGEVPVKFRVNSSDKLFWLVNLVPLAAAGLCLTYLAGERISLIKSQKNK